ncbi:MAG: RES family NAD+ phosphorylase [Nitrococcus sp.]|nr:RES family NAD+ phosphorylase [Nitrococcus sp.]
MPIVIWRLVKARYADWPLDGEGARRFGGRWNARGTPMVYLGGSLSLAALEIFVHLSSDDSHLSFVAIPVQVPDGIAVEALEEGRLPPDWREEPPPDGCKRLGSEWVAAGRTALLRVPSVIVPEEHNFLLNPTHPDAARLRVGEIRPFGFDKRMWK